MTFTITLDMLFALFIIIAVPLLIIITIVYAHDCMYWRGVHKKWKEEHELETTSEE